MMLSSVDARPSIFFTFLLLNIVSVIFHPLWRINFRICFHFKRENVFYKNSLSKKKYTSTPFGCCNAAFALNIRKLCNYEAGVLCHGSTPEVHSAGKHIREVVFLGRQWFHVSNGNGKTFRKREGIWEGKTENQFYVCNR